MTVARRDTDPELGAGRLVAGSDESPELASSLALRLPANCVDDCWKELVPPPLPY